MLQVFEARWQTIEGRMADVFDTGYGRFWLPPPAKADSGGLSVGYDVFDRFDLGSPRAETLYGTDVGLKALIGSAHDAGMLVHTDFIANHNGFRDSSTPDFVDEGDYPGFVTTLTALDDPLGVGDIDGDFHGRFEVGEHNFRLSGLIDIAQEKNHRFIRHPVDPANPANIPSGTLDDQADPLNARYYADVDQGGTTVFDPRLGQNVTLYDYNTATPLAGDAVAENATGLLIRNLRWMIQEVGVDGFRFDAARHMPTWVFDFLDQGMFLAKQETLLDGSPQHVFSFSETGFDTYGFIQSYVRKDIDNGDLGTLGGNRDALDFPLFSAMKNNLTDNGLANDWRNIKNSSQDVNDDGFANNGSQGVAFVQSHDEGGPHLSNVAYAYTLMRPGEALVYFNALEFGDERDFPQDGRGDALGGFYGEQVPTLVEIRNTHGRGDYIDRTPVADEKEMLIYEREASALVVLSNRLDGGFDSRTVATSFAPGTPLVELTGNAEDALIDPSDDFPSVLVVKPDGTVDLRVPRNVAAGMGGEVHNSGYLIYGPSGPQGSLLLNDTADNPLTTVLAGGTPNEEMNGTTRLGDITVVTDDAFKLRLETDAVNLVGAIRDQDADGDSAIFKIDGGIDANASGGVDHVTPGSVDYGFEDFTHVDQPGFFEIDGDGVYEQTIDATALAEGQHFLTVRAFRHRDDGGPPVFSDFRETVYVDRLVPEAELVSFEPFASDPDEPENRDLVFRSTDQTADNMHFFLDLPATVSDSEIMDMVQMGVGDAGYYDRDAFIFGYFGVTSGNHTATVVTFEPTGNHGIQRFTGYFTDTGLGLGIGDVDANGTFEVVDITGIGNGSFEDVLYSQNVLFHAAADENGDGVVDNHDLFALGDQLTAGGADIATLTAYADLLLRRGDVDESGMTDTLDVDILYDSFGATDWLRDLNVDGTVDLADVSTLLDDILAAHPADFNLDGLVGGLDYLVWAAGFGVESDGRFTEGDANLDGAVNGLDYLTWAAGFGSGSATLVPEPGTLLLLAIGVMIALSGRRPGRR